MPRFMPVPKLAVAPVSEPSPPILIGAPPPPCVANSAHETVPAAPAAGLAAAGALVGAAAGAAAAVVGLGAAAGAAVGGVGVAAGEQAARVSAKAHKMATGAWRPYATANIASSPPQPRQVRAEFWASRYHAIWAKQAKSFVFFRGR